MFAGIRPCRSMGRHPCMPAWQGRHCEARLQANNLIARTESEEAFELTTELRRTFISHLDARCGRRLLVSQHQQARLMKAYRLEVLHRRTLGDGTKVSVKRRDAHTRLAGQAVDGE